MDLLFLLIWITILWRKRYYLPIIWGLFGFMIYFVVEYFVWYSIMDARSYQGPIGTLIFFIWLSFSPGFAQLSFVAVMFEKRSIKELVFWVLLFFGGWTAIAFGSELISINDQSIEIARNMNKGNQRLVFLVLVACNVLMAMLLVLQSKISVKDALYIFLIGTLVELNLELSLALSTIRQEQGTWSLQLFVVNTLIEFNVGIVIFYILWKRSGTWLSTMKSMDEMDAVSS